MKSSNPATTLATPNLDQTIQQMDEKVEEFRAHNDRRERFLLMYRTFKRELRKNLQEGRFLDHQWSEAICCRMGGMYFEALEAYEQHIENCPKSWQICFDAARDKETNLLQDALMGMNAHINYDLTVCVYDVMKQNGDFEALSPDATTPLVDRKLNALLKKRYFDYLLINQIAWESIPLIQDVLTNRFSTVLGWLNKASFRFSRALVERLILDYRDRAWTHALLLLSSANEEEHQQIRSFMDDLSVSNTRLIRQFVSFNPLKLIRPALQPETIEKASEKVLDPVVADLLKRKLRQRETSEYAARTLVEYGNAAVPYLDHMLKSESDDIYLVKDVFHILGKIGTQESAELVTQKLNEVTFPTYILWHALYHHPDEIIRAFCSADRIYQQMESLFETYLDQAQMTMDLDELPEDSLFKRTLADRRKKGAELLQLLLKLLQINHGYDKSDADLRENEQFMVILRQDKGGSWAELVKQILEEEVQSVLDTRIPTFRLQAMSAEQRVASILEGPDEWLQLCLYEDAQSELFPWDIDIATPTVADKTMISTVEKVLYLKNVELFNEIPAEDLTSIAKVAQEHAFSPQEALIEQGTPGKNLYIITEGQVEVVKDDSVVTTLSEGDVLGEISLLTESSASADCLAETKVSTLQINQDDFLDFLYEGYPEIALGLIKVLIHRLEQTTERLKVTPA
ncbi:MAG: DUF5995 family protein [Bacteroidota bacterium]